MIDCRRLKAKKLRLPFVIVSLLLALLLHGSSPGQDILKFFLPGEDRYLLVGGTPFASPADMSLVESHDRGKDAPKIQYDYRVDNVYHESRSDGSQSDIVRSGRAIQMSFPLSANSLHPTIGISYSANQFDASASIDPQQQANLIRNEENFSLDYSMSIGQLIKVGGIVGQSSEGSQSCMNYESRIFIQPTYNTSFGVRTGNYVSWHLLNVNVTNVDGVLPLELQQRETEVSGMVALGSLVAKVVGFRKVLGSIPNSSREENTHFVPQGVIQGVAAVAMLEMQNRWDALFSMRSQSLGGGGSFLSGSSKYGTLDGLGFSDYDYCVGVEHHFSRQGLFVAEVQWRELTADVAGNVADWPFVSIFESPIASREMFQASGALRLWRAHTGAAIPLADNFRLGCGINYLRLEPDAKIASWEPKFLIFGIRAYEERTLPITLADILILSCGTNIKLFSLDFNYSVTQFLPIHFERKEKQQQTEAGSNTSPSGPSISTQSSGGQFHQFSLSFEF